MAESRIEYVGFTVNKKTREYRLRVKLPDGEYQTFTMAISNEAFITRRVRYQDAPDICFLKLQRQLITDDDSMPASHQLLTDAELEEYHLSHTPKPKEKFVGTPSRS